jgi:hypothetical protein
MSSHAHLKPFSHIIISLPQTDPTFVILPHEERTQQRPLAISVIVEDQIDLPNDLREKLRDFQEGDVLPNARTGTCAKLNPRASMLVSDMMTEHEAGKEHLTAKSAVGG